MVEVESCIASMLLGFVDGENGMLRSLESLLDGQYPFEVRYECGIRVAARSSGLPVGGAKYKPD
jgi:hypothetical protein